MSPQRFAAQLQTRSQAFERRVMTAEAQTAREALAEARRRSSGPHSLAGLRKAGHPFSRRRPNGAFDPSIINAGGPGRGTFKRSWAKHDPKRQGGDVVTRITNSDPNARYMAGGTSKMIMRPIVSAVVKSVARSRMRRLREAFRKTLGA